MSKLRVHAFSISLDGYGAGEVLKLLEIRLGCRPDERAFDHHAGCPGASREHPMEKRTPAPAL